MHASHSILVALGVACHGAATIEIGSAILGKKTWNLVASHGILAFVANWSANQMGVGAC